LRFVALGDGAWHAPFDRQTMGGNRVMTVSTEGATVLEAYLQPQADGLLMRKSGDWVEEKLDYLRRYIDIFQTAMQHKKWRAHHYIDLFAGPGKCIVPAKGSVLLGSPLLALTASPPFTSCFFADLDGESLAALQERCSASPQYSHVRFLEGDSNALVRGIVDEIKAIDRPHLRDQWSSINLTFLDPAGLDLHWQTVETLSEPYTMDLIIHYPQGGLNRYAGAAFNSEDTNKVDLFFGGTEWRDIYAEGSRFGIGCDHRKLMDLYKSKLQALGYQEVFRDDEVGDEPLIRNARRNAPLYRLLFASKHPLGSRFWRAVTRRNVHGQQLLFREDTLPY
jgi:three-Cys-motif partner protein